MDNHPPRLGFFIRRSSDALTVLAILLALLVLTGWLNGTWRLQSINGWHIPMAPSTAAIFIMLGIAVILFHHAPMNRAVHIYAYAAATGSASFSLLVIAQMLLNFDAGLEFWTPQVLNQADISPIGRMSIWTATAFLFLSLTLIPQLPPLRSRRLPRQIAALSNAMVLALAVIALLGYITTTSSPFLGNTIPMALLTTISFILLSLALLIDSGAETWLQNRLDNAPAMKSRWYLNPLGVFLFLTAAIGAAGAFYFRQQVEHSRRQSLNELSSISDLKVKHIAYWYEERCSDARVVMQTPMIEHQLRALLQNDGDEQTRKPLKNWMNSLRKLDYFSSVVLYDADGRVRLAAPTNPDLCKSRNEAIQSALYSKKPIIEDLHLTNDGQGHDGDVHLCFLIPVGVKPDPNTPADGLLQMRIDAARFLFPLVQEWPTPSRTAETLLIRRENDEVVFLNDLRHRSNTALKLRMKINEHLELPAAMAVLGQEGIVEGLDYRGVPVLADIRRIPGTPWYMVTKIDQDEIQAPLRARAASTGIVVFALILAAALGVGFMERRREEHWLRRQLAVETERRALADRVLLLNQYANDAILLMDRDWRILEANERALKIYDYTLDELQRMTLRDLRVPELRAHFDQEALPAKSTEGIILEIVHQRKDGTRINVESSMHTVEIGGVVYRQAIIRDITARRRAEEERDLLFNHSMDLLCIADFDGYLRQLNPAWETTLGWSVQELLGSPWIDFIHPDDRRSAVTLESDLRTGAMVHTFEARCRCKDGTYRWLSWNAHPLVGERRIFAVVRDITKQKEAEAERERLEAQLRHSQKMEAIGQLAGGVAHDFNNILTAILGNVELTLGVLKNESPDKNPIARALHSIDRSAQRAADLTKQLLAFGRRQILQPQVFDLNRMLTEIEPMLQRLISENIALEVLPSPEPAGVEADPGYIEQVVMNLVVNARDAMPNGGKLTLAVDSVLLDDKYAVAHADACIGVHRVIRVQDTGCGIAPDVIEHIFEPFFTTKEVGKGTGLGLATVYGIVAQADGHVTVQSEVGKGSTFQVYLPAVFESQPAASTEAGVVEETHGTEIILVCEDDNIVRRLAEQCLTNAGYTVIAARSGGEALAHARTRPGQIDLLITDVIMPGMNGVELSASIHRLVPDLKTLFISGYASDIVLHREKFEQGTEFLEKPFTPRSLLQSVRTLLDEYRKSPHSSASENAVS